MRPVVVVAEPMRRALFPDRVRHVGDGTGHPPPDGLAAALLRRSLQRWCWDALRWTGDDRQGPPSAPRYPVMMVATDLPADRPELADVRTDPTDLVGTPWVGSGSVVTM